MTAESAVHPRISFVVPAHNEAQLLPRTLASIESAALALGAAYEVIVVDDASDDETVAVAEARAARVIRVNHRQIAATRNSGARTAQGSVLIFLDADTCLTAEVLAAAVAAIEAGAVGGGAAVKFDGTVPLHARLGLATLNTTFRWFKLAAGCFMFCSKFAYENSGGFDESLYAAEEIAFSRALKKQGRFVMLRTPVVTSGRKVRAYSRRETVRLLWRLAIRGNRGLRSREHLDLWYGPRRRDPGD